EETGNYLGKAAIFMPFGAPEEAKTQDGGARKARDFADIRALPDGDVFGALKDYIAELKRKTLIAAYSEGSRERLKGMLAHAGMEALHGVEKFSDARAGQINLAVLGLESGFVADDLAVLTEQDILG